MALFCCFYCSPLEAYTQQYNVGDTGPNGGTVTSSTVTSVVTNTEVTLNGGFEDTTTTTQWTETVIEEIRTSQTTTQQTSQITATTTSNFVPTINSSDWSTTGRIKLQGATQCRTGGANATVGAGQACTGYQNNVNNSLIQDANNYNFTTLGGGQITSEKFEMAPDLTIAEIQSGMTLNYGVDVQSHKSNLTVPLCASTGGDCKDVFKITTRLYRCADCYGGGKFAEYSNTVTLTYNGTQTHSFTQDLSSTMLTNNNVTEVWGQMELWGVDAGYHTGYYGPTFSNPFMTLTYDAITMITETITNIVLSNQTTVYNSSEDVLTSVFIGDPTTDTTVIDVDYTEVDSFEIVIANEDTGGGIEMEFSVDVDETTNVATVDMSSTNLDTGIVQVETIAEINLNFDMDTGATELPEITVAEIEADIGSQIDSAVADAVGEIDVNVDTMPDVNIEVADASPTLEVEIETSTEATTEVNTSTDAGEASETGQSQEVSETEGESNTTSTSSTEEVQESDSNAEQSVEENNSENTSEDNGDADSGEDTSGSETDSETDNSGTDESSETQEDGADARGEKSGGEKEDSKGSKGDKKSNSKPTKKSLSKERIKSEIAKAKQKIANRILSAMADTYSAINETTKIALMQSLSDTENFKKYVQKQNQTAMDWYSDTQIYNDQIMLGDPYGALFGSAQDNLMNDMINEQYKLGYGLGLQ
ncbi:MAG: hypothetical protein CMA64_06985 [Euryarchaeota archaeon]|nr:hypothetical protein [Euryarchaeota archaeon]